MRAPLILGLLAMIAGAPGGEATTPAPAALDPASAGIGGAIADLGFVDAQGRSGSLWALAAGRPLVIACTSPDCPIARRYAPRIAELQRTYGERVGFLVLDVGQDADAAALAAATGAGIAPPLVNDHDLALARALGVRTTTGTLILDRDRRLRFRGAIDDRHGLTYDRDERAREYLVDALEAVLAGRPVAIPATSAPGCDLPADGAGAAIPALTWSNQVARILQGHCQQCHRPDGGAPFSLLTWEQAQRKAPTIARVVAERAMPPWFADPHVGGPWANDRRLADAEVAALVAWAAADCPRGDPADAPPPRTWPGEWELGTPDAVVQVEQPIAVPAQGRMDYQYVRVVTGFPEDRWVSAVELRPTANGVVHHAQAFLEIAGKPDYDDRFVGEGRLHCYFASMVPGACSQTYPAGTARLLPKGATVLFEIHYVPNGTATSDRMRLGLVFAKQRPEHEIASFDVRTNAIDLAPGAKDRTYSARYALPVAARLLNLQPHMHLRGRSFTFDVISPDGAVTHLLSVPAWDFRWQLSYRLATPLDVPAGTTLVVTGTYDNSADNPANPDPTARVRTGGETTDEMLVGFGEWHALEAMPAAGP